MLESAAQSYLAAGLSVLPARRAEKRPAIGRWKAYQSRRPTQAELLAWIANGPDGLCIICGTISGNLEIIDFDGGGELFDAWRQKISCELYDRIVIETTPSGGYHVIYRCTAEVSGNLKLAQRKTDSGIQTLIETRGEGGLFLCAPTQGYECTQGDLSGIPTLSQEQRLQLLEAAWALNEYIQPVPASNTSILPSNSDRPGDAFNQHGDVRALLQKHGWQKTHEDAINEYYRRPGKTSGHSASLRKEDRTFVNFSSNAPFEPYKGYSPFHVLAVLDHGGDFSQAAQSLVHMGYGGHTTPQGGECADLSGIMAQCAESREEATESPTVVDPGPISPDMLRVPGFVSEVMDHTMETAPYPNPVMAFAGALSLLAFLTGRKVRDGGDNRTNLYLLGLAHSAAGKDWPRKVNTRILHEVGQAECLGERFASGEAIQDALFQTPSMLFQTDEIDGMLQSINRAKDARHEAVLSTLLTMYSSSNSVYPMRRKAGKESSGVINQPNLVIFGTAIPNHYYEALSERMLTNGFFARMIILEAGPRSAGQEPRIGDLPQRVLETARYWSDYRPGTNNLEQWNPSPVTIEHTDNARNELIETRREAEVEYAAAESRSDAVGTTVWGRVSEQTRKLALLYAVSENHETPQISSSAVQWASTFVMHQTRRMLFMAASHVADGDFDAMLKRAVGLLRQWHEKHGPDALMPGWELRRRLKQRPGDFKDIVCELLERRIAVSATESTSTKPRSGYRLL